MCCRYPKSLFFHKFIIHPKFTVIKQKETKLLCRQLVPFTLIILSIITYSIVIVKFLGKLIKYTQNTSLQVIWFYLKFL